MKTLIFLFAIAALLFGSLMLFNKQPESSLLFNNYQVQWNKKYATPEIEEYRRIIFYENVAKIEAHNATPGITYWEGINQFTDLTQEECVMTYLGDDGGDYVEPTGKDLETVVNDYPDVDWDAKGKVSPVKNQGSCGSCYSFGAVANLESLNLIFGTKELVQYSEQMIVDCSKPYGNNGCGGGLAIYSFKFVKEKGIVTLKEYPYIGREQQCKAQTGPFKIKDFIEWNQKGCDEVIKEIQERPLAVRVYAQNWFNYSGGIFTKCDAPAQTYGHAVFMSAVAQKDGYWRIKNSWGTTWGEKGFIRLKFPGSCCNVCGDFSTGVL